MMTDIRLVKIFHFFLLLLKKFFFFKHKDSWKSSGFKLGFYFVIYVANFLQIKLLICIS